MNLFMVVGGRSLCGWRLAGREEWDALFWREGEGRLNSTHFFGGKSGTIKFDALFWREEWGTNKFDCGGACRAVG
jgi:hypothetical protein